MFMFFILFILAATIFTIKLIINGVILAALYTQGKKKESAIRRIRKNMIVLLGICISCAVFVWLTQLTAHTPAIRDSNGKKIETSIAELKPIILNNRKEWISIRGNDKNNPVLLFLAGGPGGTQMAQVRHDLKELEKHFVVVNWDQAGSGKSYEAIELDKITIATYIEDGYELTKYLCSRFGQQKIYLAGESWGSALGIFLVDKSPELYHAFIGSGQMVSFLDTEIIDYELAMKLAQEKGDTKTLKTLKTNGRPPYYGNDITWKSMVYLQYLNNTMAANPKIEGGYHTFRDLFSSEYGILDKINYFRGIVNTFNTVYPQLYDIDLRKDYPVLKVPVYFLLGRHDLNAPISLAENYFKIVSAPAKELIFFEHSGHSPMSNESSQFVREFLRVTGVNGLK